MFTYTYQPRYGDFKDFDTIKPGMLLDAIQDVSIRDSARCGYDLDSLRQSHLAWLMQGINVTFFQPAKTLTDIEVSTAVKSLKGVSSERGCILTQNGVSIAKSIASWFLFDTEAQRITRVAPEMISAYDFWDFDEECFLYQKLRPRAALPADYTVRVANKDIDTNRHLNNQKGADMLMDALPFDFSFTRLNILYKKPAYLGDVLEVCRVKTETGYYVHLQTAEKDVCVAGTFENL